jgi:signal peptidase
MSGTRRKPKKHGLLYYIGLGLSAGLLGLLLLLGALVIVIPALTGSTPMTILTSSMEPTYPPGTLIIVQPVSASEIHVGEPITYQLESGKPAVVTHRVVAISSSDAGKTFTTKGDNNAVADPKPVMPVQVRGHVWYSVPYIGFLSIWVSGDNRSWIVPVVVVALFTYAGFMFASGINGALRRRRRRVLAEQ